LQWDKFHRVAEVLVDEDNRRKKEGKKKMTKRENWIAKFEEASENLNEWRKQKPKATFTEIENNVDQQLAKVRTEMIKELAMESELTDFKQLKGKERPKCPGCGKPLAANGKQKRRLRTTQGEEVELERRKGYCRDCRASFFPPGRRTALVTGEIQPPTPGNDDPIREQDAL
jgi:hypothetical protein